MLSKDEHFITWDAAVTAHAHFHDLADVLNSTFRPTTSEETALFRLKNNFMHSVFIHTLQTDKGKSIVREHERNRDAQKVCEKIKAHCTSSTGAAIASSKKLECAVMARLNTSNWSGTTHGFLLHWKQKLCHYHQQSPEMIPP